MLQNFASLYFSTSNPFQGLSNPRLGAHCTTSPYKCRLLSLQWCNTNVAAVHCGIWAGILHASNVLWTEQKLHRELNRSPCACFLFSFCSWNSCLTISGQQKKPSQYAVIDRGTSFLKLFLPNLQMLTHAWAGGLIEIWSPLIFSLLSGRLSAAKAEWICSGSESSHVDEARRMCTHTSCSSSAPQSAEGQVSPLHLLPKTGEESPSHSNLYVIKNKACCGLKWKSSSRYHTRRFIFWYGQIVYILQIIVVFIILYFQQPQH